MRPRINAFGKITKKELESYFMENQVYGFTVKIDKDSFIYSYDMMFRKNKENPEMIFIEVSQTSKLVLKAWANKGITFKNIDELKKYTKK